jgi:wyosine [tRNA(Phe)-imidazoG37] synthetase (radical SAM superfamily)
MSISELSKAWANHSRSFKNFRFVYPVISRRAGGLSIGINCTPNGQCSFNCIYCQSAGGTGKNPTIDEIIFELKKILDIYKQNKFAEHFPRIEEKDRLLKDIAFSGNGEPTLYPHFTELCNRLQEENIKLILITNAAQIMPSIVEGLEVWGKLDAGTDEWFNFINRPNKKMSIAEIENNLKFMVSKLPLRIQTMLCEAKGKIPSEEELKNYCQIVKRIYETNPANLLSVQLYSIVRQTPEDFVLPLPREFLENVKKMLEKKISKLSVEVF